jgi:YD repeat-containing protein
MVAANAHAVDRIAIADAFLKQVPEDPYAHLYRAYALENTGRREAALKAQRTATERFPTRSRTDDEAELLIRLGRTQEAKKLLAKRRALLYDAKPEAAELAKLDLVDALAAAGEVGAARKQVDELLADSPDSGPALAKLASYELDVSRAKHALPAIKKAVALEPGDAGRQATLIRALRESGKTSEAQKAFERAKATVPEVTRSLYNQGYATLVAAKRHSDALALAEEGARAFPGSGWMRRNVAEGLWLCGDKKKAIETLSVAFEMDPNNTWTHLKLVEWVEDVQDKAAARKALAKLSKQAPYVEALWTRRLGIAGSGKATAEELVNAKLPLARAGRKANPDQSWAWRLELSVLVDAERWDEAWKFAKNLRTASKDWTVGNQKDVLLLQMWVVVRELEKRRVDEKRIKWILEQAKEYREVDETNYQSYIASFQDALGQPDLALEAKLAWVRQSPDDKSGVWALVRHSGGQTEAMQALHRYVARNPYDGPRLETAAHIQAKWGGSPVVALRYATWARERVPDNFSRADYSTALGHLGDAARHYESTYQRARGIGDSERYIRWWENARKKAQGDSTRVALSFDPSTRARCKAPGIKPVGLSPDTPYATICSASGDVLIRADDPVTGRPLLRQMGENFLRAEYDDRGKLVLVETSGGRRVQLDYNAKGEITALHRADGSKLTFKYNAQGKPTEIKTRGKALRVTYTPNGDIDDVESDDGHATKLDIATAFEELLSLTEPLGNGELPRLEAEDKKRTLLQSELAREFEPAKRLPAQLALAKYLTDHLQNGGSYGNDAESLLSDAFGEVRRNRRLAKYAPRVAETYHELMRRNRKAGLTREEYERAGDMRAWLRTSGSKIKGAKKTLAKLEKQALHLREPDRWLEQSDLVNEGMWRRHLYSAMVPDAYASRAFHAALVRKNGDLVVGGAGGLSVRRSGFWEWYPFVLATGRFDPNVEPAGLGPSTEALSLAESGDGALWIGTADGLIRLEDDYEGAVMRWAGPGDGLPSARVEKLQPWGSSSVLVGSASGARVFAKEGASPELPELASEQIVDINLPIVTTADALWWVEGPGGRATRISRFAAEAAAWSQQTGGVVAMSENALWLVTPNADDMGRWIEDGASGPVALPASNNLLFSKRIYGVTSMEVAPGASALAIYTDQGIGFHREHHVEHLKLPNGDSTPSVQAVAARGQVGIALTNEGAFVYERGRVHDFFENERVYDILTVPEAKVTYVATRRGLFALMHAAPEAGPQLVDYADVRRIVSDREGGIVTHDGRQIRRYDAKTGRARALFSARPSSEKSERLGNGVQDLLVSTDGTVWAAAGPSLFRLPKGADQPEEFSLYVDHDKFPSRTHFISRVVETVDGKIWVIGSNEGHLEDEGIILRGGVLEYADGKFKRIELEDETDGWFIHRYTQIDKRTALASTTDGIAIHTASGAYELLSERDPSYKRLRKRVPSLFMGTRGAKLGEDLWLFGTAGGVVGYWRGQWIYPDRLNWMLPDQGLASYGTRAVHALDTDASGRVYIGTDRGLTVYDTGSADAGALLVDNGFVYEAFEDAAARQLNLETDVIVNGLTPGSKLAERVERIADARRDYEKAQERLARNTATETGKLPRIDEENKDAEDKGGGEGKDDEVSSRVKDLQAEVRRKRTVYHRKLLELERENPTLHQMLARKPLELEAARQRLPRGMSLVLYLPTKERLYIQVLTRESAVVREVNVSQLELFQTSISVASSLGSLKRAKNKLRAHLETQAPANSATASEGNSVRGTVRSALSTSRRKVNAEEGLAWLYERLLRPVELDLQGSDYTYVVPAGPLTYVPFEALIRNSEGETEYAVEKFALGYLTEAHMFEVMLHSVPSSRSQTVVFADPDGSLPIARKEGKAVAGRAAGNLLRVGAEAKYESLIADVPQAGHLHLATHGVLDSRRPEKSYLLLANDYLLTVPDAATLDLKQANMVVLSACQSGIGMQGLEYATLARVFMVAGAQTVVATLWQVPDYDSTNAIIQSFYKAVDEGKNRVIALAEAKRQYLDTPGAVRDPHFWAGFVLFGSG